MFEREYFVEAAEVHFRPEMRVEEKNHQRRVLSPVDEVEAARQELPASGAIVVESQAPTIGRLCLDLEDPGQLQRL